MITGALPAQFGLRTSGVVDIQTRNAFDGGTVGVYGGSRQTLTPSFEYGGQVGQTQYFLTGRFFESNIGLENPTPNWAAIHDHTTQERGFAYVSTILDPYSRFTLMAGASYGAFQIPNTPGLAPNFTAFGISNFNSALLNENQVEQSYWTVAAWQRSINGADVQLSYFNRYSSVHFTPDPIGDIIFNGVASQVFRSDFANGVTGDIAYRLNEAHTLRAGLLMRTDKTQVTNTDTLEPLDAAGNPIDAPFTVVDPSSLLGYTVGLYVQDEWKLTNSLTLNAGIRFDQYWEYITEYQFSPRISLTWKPFESTAFHIGYARNFTPPEQVLAAPTNLALVQNTTQQPSVNLDSPVRAERRTSMTSALCSKCFRDWKQALTLITKKRLTSSMTDSSDRRSCSPRSTTREARIWGSNFPPNTRTARSRLTAILPWRGRSRPIRSRTNSCLTTRRRSRSRWPHRVSVPANPLGLHRPLAMGDRLGRRPLPVCGRPARPDEWMSASGADACGIRLSGNMIYGSGLRDGDANISTVHPIPSSTSAWRANSCGRSIRSR